MSSVRKACHRSKEKAKEAELERIRNNQRRSRARRKDYVAALEEKIHSYENYENLGGQTAIDSRLRHLTHENELLRRLLHSMGLRSNFLQAYIKASDVASGFLPDRLDGQIASCASSNELQLCENHNSPHIRDTFKPHQCTSATDTISESQPDRLIASSSEHDTRNFVQDSPQVGQGLLQSEAALPLEFFFGVSSSTRNASTHLESGIGPQDAFQLVDSVPDNIPYPIPMASDDATESSTLCSLAFSLILKNNRKGYTVTDLDLKLRAGYRYGIVGFENCRVDNSVLLKVLAEIS